MSSIFVSHSSEDQGRVNLLVDWLKPQGHASYFLDFDPEKSIAAGKRWEVVTGGPKRVAPAFLEILRDRHRSAQGA